MASRASAQPECAPWGNLYGVRMDGHLFKFESSICLLETNGNPVAATGHYRVKPKYQRDGLRQITSSRLGAVEFHQVVTDGAPGQAKVEVTLTPMQEQTSVGGYFCIELPTQDFPNGSVEFIGRVNGEKSTSIAALAYNHDGLRLNAKGICIRSDRRTLWIESDSPGEIILRDDSRRQGGGLRIYFAVLPALAKSGATASRTFSIQVSGEIDRSPALIKLDTGQPGRAFDGIGGNFRMQFPEADPAIIDYNLTNLRVAWARTCMWWRDWDPDEAGDPLASALAGKITKRTERQLQNDRMLARRGIPFIVSTWDPPRWASLEIPRRSGTYGDPLNPAKQERIANSITAYLLYLKQQLGIEPALFSYNEPDIGIEVLQTPEEHMAAIKTLGRSFAANGLATKLLLGDTSNASREALRLAEAALNDDEALRYVGAVGFHSWGACTDENLTKWAEISRRLNVPLMITETGVDSEAHQNPDLFLESSYQLQQADLYVRMLALCQPKNLLEWQLTADYSVLDGGNAYDRKGDPQPTMRFWLLKQLGDTPAGSFALPATCTNELVSCAAFGDIANGTYTLHLVNNGAARDAIIQGLPTSLKNLRVLVTDAKRGLSETPKASIVDGKSSVPLGAGTITTIIATP